MKNFLQHKDSIIDNFCNTFKVGAYKEMYGVNLNCNVKKPELVWLAKELYKYQDLSKDVCLSGCTYPSTYFIQSARCSATGTSVFEPIDDIPVCTPYRETFRSGCCYVVINISGGGGGNTVGSTQVEVGATGGPVNGTTTFTLSTLIGKTIQFALSGYGFYLQGDQFIFNSTTGTITLLTGLLFNTGEVYTIFYYS